MAALQQRLPISFASFPIVSSASSDHYHACFNSCSNPKLPCADRIPSHQANVISRRLFLALIAAAAISLSPLVKKAGAYEEESNHVIKSIGSSAQISRYTHHLRVGSILSGSGERLRFFDSKAKRQCWDKAKMVPGRDPDRWRINAAGNIVCKHLHTCQGCLCYEYDHIIPFSKGGQSVVENCQILQTRVNRSKSDRNDIGHEELKGLSCNIKFSDEELDAIEMAVYGSVSLPGKKCTVGNIDGVSKKFKSKDRVMHAVEELLLKFACMVQVPTQDASPCSHPEGSGRLKV